MPTALEGVDRILDRRAPAESAGLLGVARRAAQAAPSVDRVPIAADRLALIEPGP